VGRAWQATGCWRSTPEFSVPDFSIHSKTLTWQPSFAVLWRSTPS
jgi:hypothetical protein